MNEKFQKVTFEELQNLKTVLSFSTRYKIKSFKNLRTEEQSYKLFRKNNEFWIFNQEDCERFGLQNTKQVEKKNK